MHPGTIISIVQWVIIGGIAGYVASVLLKAQRMGCFVNIIIGIVGAFIGGFIMNLLFPAPPGQLGGLLGIGFLDAIINAIVGAVLLLIVLELILPGKQLGVRDEEDGGGRRRRRR